MTDDNRSSQFSRAVRTLLRLAGTLKFWLAVFGLITCVFVYYWTAGWPTNADEFYKHTKTFIISFIPNVIATLAIVLITYLIFRHAIEYQAELDREMLADLVEQRLKPLLDPELRSANLFERFVQVEWRKLFQRSRKIQIVVQYFDSWINSYPDEFRSLLNRGGEIVLILPNPAVSGIVQQIHARFPDKTRKSIVEKIKGTVDKVLAFKKDCKNPKATVKIVYVDIMVWYCAVVFDERDFILSPFEHSRGAVVEAPAFYAQLDKYPRLKEWWQREINGLLSSESEEAKTF